MPLTLPANQPPRFYRGGPRIAALRAIKTGDDHLPEDHVPEDHLPEDWVGSTTSTFGTDREGLSTLADGRLLRAAVAADPEAFLGRGHVERFGCDPRLLVKLLDAGERLPVHLHPGRAFARRHLGSEYGKTEAWVIVSAEPGARVHVGFRHDVAAKALRDWVTRNDAEALLGALHEVPVSAGDALLVPAGTAHAIGEGILLVELQEPTDFSILLEQPAADDLQPELGLGWEVALHAVDRAGVSEPQLQALAGSPRRLHPGASTLLPEVAAPYFRAERIEPDPVAELDPGFSVLIVLEGDGRLSATAGERGLARGDTVLIPHAAGRVQLYGELVAVRCRPPDPAAGVPPW
ncbi:MAG: class I mannose-6-phosphate isomerase [Solirubrobacteraceae bacterium]